MINEKNAANAIGGNTARACDSCLVKRARWFCGADDAFLCKKCDASVHSANQLASRHERVQLQASSFKANNEVVPAKGLAESPPAWHQGFTRKARTPRHNNNNNTNNNKNNNNNNKNNNKNNNNKKNNNKAGFMAKNEQEKVGFNPPLPFVPEVGCEEASFMDDDENEDLEQLLYRVPIYDPFAAELCNNMSSDAMNLDDEVTEIKVGDDDNNNNDHELDNSQGFLPSDMELAEFTADVENLLGGGLDEDSGDMKGVFGLLEDSKLEEEDGGVDFCVNNHGVNEEARREVKVEEELLVEGTEFNPSMLDWSLDYDHNHRYSSSPPILFGGEEEEKVVFLMGAQSGDEVAFMENKQVMMMKRKKICLRLNYEAVMTAWGHQGGSPWTTGTPPELNPSDDSWLDCMGMWPSQVHQPHGDGGRFGGGRGDDRGREARVSRYREKRRTRLFSKKIRYEVRKLNAEKRPRMKGRFVKRTSSSSSNSVGSNSSRNNAAAATVSFPYLISK